MYYKRSKLLILLLFLSACTVSPIKPPKLSNSEFFAKIKQENPYSCNIKRKGVFSLENRFNKSKFKGYIVKTCDNNFKLNILGLFNQIAYKVVFADSELEVFKADKNVSNELSIILSNEEVQKMASLLNIPALVPDNSYEVREDSNERYMLSKDGTDVFINSESFKIEEISKDNTVLTYSYDDDEIKQLNFLDTSIKIHIKFF